tara:strand:+ start:2834 stop:3454 length:621 start_codon:yes stop_codon:yes gene_type:complete
MKIEIKKSIKYIRYQEALDFLERRCSELYQNKAKEIIWTLEHKEIYTCGTNFKRSEILDKSIDLYKSNRGGKVTWHGPGQKIFYFVINLNKRKKDIRRFIKVLEKTIIQTLKEYGIKSFSDRKDIGIWVNHEGNTKKIAAIGIKIKRWIAFHGFAINVSNNLSPYKKIIPCGIKDKKVTNLISIKKQSYKNLEKKLIKNFLNNLEY